MASNITTTDRSVQVSPASSASVTLMEMREDPQRFPRLRSYTIDQATYEMSKIVSQAFLYRGQAADATNIRFISNALVTELLDDQYGSKNLCFAEIQRVVKKAILGSEMFGISVSSLYKVILDYVKGEGARMCQEVNERRRKASEMALSASPITPLLQVAAGKLITNTKIK